MEWRNTSACCRNWRNLKAAGTALRFAPYRSHSPNVAAKRGNVGLEDATAFAVDAGGRNGFAVDHRKSPLLSFQAVRFIFGAVFPF